MIKRQVGQHGLSEATEQNISTQKMAGRILAWDRGSNWDIFTLGFGTTFGYLWWYGK